MVDARHPFPRLTTAAALTVALVASGCVTRGTFRSEVEQLRQEIREGDGELDQRLSGVAGRVDAVEGRMLDLERELMALEEEFGARVERMEAALRVHTPVYFGFDESQLEADQLPVLDRLASVLREYYPEALITVEGFTDPAGSAAYNLQLGQQRADEVRSYLLSQGFTDNQIRTVSYGKDVSRLIVPGAQGPGPEGRENRRVVIVIDHPTAGSALRTVTN